MSIMEDMKDLSANEIRYKALKWWNTLSPSQQMKVYKESNHSDWTFSKFSNSSSSIAIEWFKIMSK